MDRVLTDADLNNVLLPFQGIKEDDMDYFALLRSAESAILAKLADRLEDADRWKEVWSHGLPFTFLGVEYHDKESCDAAIDQARRK